MKIGDRIWPIFWLDDDVDLPHRWDVDRQGKIIGIVYDKQGKFYLLQNGLWREYSTCGIRYAIDFPAKDCFITKRAALKECERRNRVRVAK